MCNVEPTEKRQRFKGVENFLRRVAFNLGNTPSQTEVKIISCIPIDVSDLQQKIISLEKQLEEAKSKPQGTTTQSQRITSDVRTAIGEAHLPKHSVTLIRPSYDVDPREAQQIYGGCCSLTQNEANSFVLPDSPVNDHGCVCYSSTSNANDADNTWCRSSERKKNIFKRDKKKKVPKKKDKTNTQLIYYAQNLTNSPFTTTENDTQNKAKKNSNTLSQTYLLDVIRKQYRPEVVDGILSDSSQFSSPVCRDTRHNCGDPPPYESEICSCCHGTFHNIDHHIHQIHAPNHNYDTLYTQPVNQDNRSVFYDSSLYDVVPVKERSVKMQKDVEYNERRKPKTQLGMTDVVYCYPENSYRKQLNPVINYHTVQPPRRKRVSNNKSKREEVLNIMANRGRLPKTIPEQDDDSNICSVDCSGVYMKRLNIKPKPQKIITPNRPIVCKNAECLTQNINNMECQTVTTKSVQLEVTTEDNKTEETLNQIKSILQTVLTEVKTNAQIKIASVEAPKKDAVVQKETSQNNMPGCSSLLHSFTYSPYNMNPYLASCSRQMNPVHPYHSNIPYPPCRMQNFPLLIQSPRHACATCYRDRTPPPNQVRNATTTATNTDPQIREGRSKETEKLIKEIYKSIALNIPTKDSSASEYEYKHSQNSSILSDFKHEIPERGKFVARTVSNAPQKIDTTTTPMATNTTDDSEKSNTESLRSQAVSTDTERQLRNKRIEILLENRDIQQTTETEVEQERVMRAEQQRRHDEDEEETESSSSEVESDDTIIKVEEPVKKKKGLFGMLRSVKLFKKNKNKKEKPQAQEEASDDSESDSDDYQTIYSHKIEKTSQPPKPIVHQTRSPQKIQPRRPHSKISYTRQAMQRDRNTERSRRSPYMEQEYRRYWNEKLMFHNDQRYSSEQPSRETPARSQFPPFWQNYEARSVVVGRNGQPYAPQYPPNYNPVRPRMNQVVATENTEQKQDASKAKGLAWLKKYKLNMQCGEQWKKLILES